MEKLQLMEIKEKEEMLADTIKREKHQFNSSQNSRFNYVQKRKCHNKSLKCVWN